MQDNGISIAKRPEKKTIRDYSVLYLLFFLFCILFTNLCKYLIYV